MAAAALAAGVAASAWLAEVRLAPLLDPAGHARVRDFVVGLFPAELSAEFLRVVGLASARTLGVAVVGTLLSIAIALPLGLLGTATLFRRGPLLAGEPWTWRTRLLAWLSALARGVLGVLRAVPDLVWAMLFVVAVGLGAVPGVLALAVSYGGVLGRVFADLFEDVDPRPLEALRATGATRAQVFVFGIWPQALPSVVAYTLYSFECCVRAAAVLGLVGAGGIGYEIALSMRQFAYGEIVTLVGALLLLMWLTESASAGVRRLLRANAAPGPLALLRAPAPAGPAASRMLAVAAALAALSLFAAGWMSRDVLGGATLGGVLRLAGELVPPDVSPGYLWTLLRPVAQTLGISVISTLIGVLGGGLLGIAATAPSAEADRAGPLRRGVRRGCRAALALLRAVPDVLWVLLFILAVGLGPFAGTLALGVHTAGVLGKLYADALEEVSPLPLRGLRATGATRLQILAWGAWPEARRMLVSYTVLRWEMNLRASTVVGLAGGGGIGIELYNQLQLGFYPRVATLLLVVGGLVAMTGAIGDRIRRRLDAAAAGPVLRNRRPRS